MDGKIAVEAPRQLEDLKPNMELEGEVTKVELSGAFLDVGLEDEGFIHISMLKRGHTNRVEDVIQIGQKLNLWVRRVDPTSRRLELTMIRPVSLKWTDIKSGLRVKGKIVRLETFGAFVDIGAERPGLVHVSEMSNDYVKDPKEIVAEGDTVDVLVKDVDRKKRQISLSMKSSDQMEMIEDDEPVVEIATAMEVALRQALENSEQRETISKSETKTRDVPRNDQDDILRRTLQQRLST